ncbi:hypothetical protein [Neptunomonas concharum]|uniref:Phage abortive infection protein n=1 Tax=Neptunomonas concharum TaxID=1031538 RepID=A0A5P1RBH7_9GAMM|nr:hypothetical protein [Neptunomonas concharum]QEQ96611.1 hypothetical protein F0U83_07740 [Neptunomonas concharum]
MSKVLVPLLSIILFQSILFLLSGVSSVFKDVSSGFTLFIDTASKGATVAVFIWAVFLFLEQRKDKKEDVSLQRLKELSFRLIDFVGNANFLLNKNSANILITYLSALKSEAENKGSTTAHLKEYKLALDIVYESLKSTSLVDIIGVESPESYHDIIDTLTSYYSNNEKLIKIDVDLIQRIENGSINNTNFTINVPSHGLRLSQIEKIMSYLLEVKEDDIKKELERKPNSTIDRHHHFPTLYAFYYFYTVGILHVSKNKDFSFSTGGL